MSACCLVVRPRLDTDMKPLPPRASSVSPSFQEEGGSWNDGDEEMRREIQAAASLKSTLECVKFESKDAENKGDDDNKDSVLSIKKAIEKVVDKATGVLKELVGECVVVHISDLIHFNMPQVRSSSRSPQAEERLRLSRVGSISSRR